MGIVRFLLAISVVGAHGAFPILIGGPRAVQIFFLISGFLISFVLMETSKYNQRLSNFYISRYLRLWPIYGLLAVFTLGFHVAHPQTGFLDNFALYPPDGQSFLIFTNFTLLLQDWTMFLGTSTGELAFDPSFRTQPYPQFWLGLINPPGWSLGVELTFYLIAPFILHRRWLIWVLLFVSIGLRGALAFWLGVDMALSDPWQYRFFPTELAFFLMGVLAQQLSSQRRWFLWHSPALDAPIIWTLVGLLFVFPFLEPLFGLSLNLMTAPLYLAFLLGLPTLFRFQCRSWDRWIGELSYPIYICHWLVLIMAQVYVPGFATSWQVSLLGESYNIWTLVLVIPVAVGLSWVLNVSVGAAVERLRSRFQRSAHAPS